MVLMSARRAALETGDLSHSSSDRIRKSIYLQEAYNRLSVESKVSYFK